MHDFKHILAAGAVLACLLPTSGAGAQGRQGAAPAYASRYTAQYDDPSYGQEGGGGPEIRGPHYGSRGAYRGAYSVPERPAPWGYAGGTFAYRGFRIRPAYSVATAQGARELAAARRQIAIVQRARLSRSDLRLFRRQPIDFGRSGHFTDGDVVLGPVTARDSRPILLHEYMHVYHRDRLPGGFANPTVRGFYEQALASNLYPQGSYMMSNVREFFAMTASCFLNGTVARPPHTREAIRAAQPAYYAYLAQLFGRGRGG